MPRVLIITSGGITKGSTRVRVLNYVPLLKAQGLSVTVVEPVRRKDRLAWLLELPQLLQKALVSDVVLVQKRLFSTWAGRLLHRCTRRLIYEFDDPIFLEGDEGKIVPERQRRLAAILQLADEVTVDNPGLGEYASQYNSRVTVIPSCVDTTVYTPRPRPTDGDGRFVMGWVGHPSNLCYLEDIEPAFAMLQTRHRDQLVLKVVCSEPYHSDHVPVINKQWSLDGEPDDIASFDVGIVPLREYPWTKYKIAYRPYLLMALERPVVLSPAGPSAQVIEHGREGFLARDPSEWVAALEALIADSELRQRMGKAGRKKVEADFTYQANLPKLLRVLDPTWRPAVTNTSGG